MAEVCFSFTGYMTDKAHDQIPHMADNRRLRSIGYGLIPHMADAQADIYHIKDKAYCPLPHIAEKPPCVPLIMTETCHVWDKAWPYDSCGKHVSQSLQHLYGYSHVMLQSISYK